MSAPFADLPQPPRGPDPIEPEAPARLFPSLVREDAETVAREAEEFERDDVDRLGMTDEEIVAYVVDMRDESKTAKEGKPTQNRLSRSDEWLENIRAYNTEYDTSQKAEWQAAERMPEVFQLTERFVAFVKQSLIEPGDWYDVTDPTDPDGLMTDYAKKIVRIMLERSGRNRFGQVVGFDYTIAQIAKAGALMYFCLKITIDENGHSRIEPVDPKELHLDPTGRGQWRIHDYDVDRSTIESMKAMEHEDGSKVFDGDALDRMKDMVGHTRKERETHDKQEQRGHPDEHDMLRRRPANLLDFYGYLCNNQGDVTEEKVYIVVGNEGELIRGPERNPFWHGNDWYIGCPVIEVPDSVWGKTYVEAIRPLWEAYTDATNSLMDAFNAAVLNVNGIRTEALEDPTDAEGGVHPGKTFQIDEDWPQNLPWLESVKIGDLPQEAFAVWEALGLKTQEAGFMSDIQLGKGVKADTTATEVDATVQSSSAFNTSIATTIETQALTPALEQVFINALQALDPENDPELAAELGPELSGMISAQRQEFRERHFRWKATGLSNLVERGRRVRSTMGFFNILGGSEELKAAFQQDYSLKKLMGGLMRDLGLPVADLQITPQERLEQQQAQLLKQLQLQGGQPPQGPPGPDSAGGAALAGGVDTDGPVSADPEAQFSGGNDVG